MTTAPEFSRTIRVDSLGEAPRTIDIEADEAERGALARRFGFVSISRLAAQVALARSKEKVSARGTVRAALVQSCVATGEPVEEIVEEPFEIAFHAQPAGEEEIELGAAELDIVFYDGALIDVGEAVAETLSLAAALFPRSPAAEETLRAAGIKSEEEAGPFGALSALRDKLAE